MKKFQIFTACRLAPLLCVAALLCACVAPADTPAGNSPAVHGAGLACFSATLPGSDKNETPPETCDALCATRDAACVGAVPADRALLLPLPVCGDPSPSTLTCRCCRVSP